MDTLINVFNIFEIICWDKIKENLSNSYLMEINENIIKNINKYFKNENIKENEKLITKRSLATAIRRFISRYLSGKRGDNEINENNKLILYITRQELWDDYALIENEDFEVELSLILNNEENNSSILVGHAKNIYEILGGDKDLLKEYFSKLDKTPYIENNKNKINKEKEEINQNNNVKINEEEEEDDDVPIIITY